MTKWAVSFIVDGKHFSDTLEVLTPYKVEDLAFKIVAGTPKKIRAGDKPAWEIVAGLATDKPQPTKVFHEALRKAGFKSTATGIDQAYRNRAVRKLRVKGVLHLVKGAKK